MRLILASASPRRADLLRAAAIDFEVLQAVVDESPRAGESPVEYVRRVAEAKARAIAARAPDRVVLAADTVVVVEGEILGKPKDAGDARRMLGLLSGRAHEVMTGVAVIGPLDGLRTKVAVTSVEFSSLTGNEIDWYVASGEPLDKAGAYADRKSVV